MSTMMKEYSNFSYGEPANRRGAEEHVTSNGTMGGISVVFKQQPVLHTGTVRHRVSNHADRAISNFQIVFESGEKCQPGTDIVGKVTMDVWSHIDIKYLEFVIQGKAYIRQFSGHPSSASSFSQRPRTETYLDKKILLISPQNGKSSLVLNPGKYVSSFLYKLPENIPPTVEQTNLGRDGHVFSISYSVQANICDYISTKNTRREQYAQIIKSTKRMFTVIPELDYQSLPGSLDPITHAEQFNVGLYCINRELTSILVRLNHQVYSLGDIMGLHLELYTPDPDRIGSISADFEQRIVLKTGDSVKEFKSVIIRALDDPHQRKFRIGPKAYRSNSKGPENLYKTGFKIPIHKTIPSLLPHCKLISVYYIMNILVKFQNLGGKLQMRIPVTIAPAMDPNFLAESLQKNIPVFNKPIMQFPLYFASKNPMRDSNRSIKSTTSNSFGSNDSIWNITRNGAINGKKKKATKHEKVRVTYKNCFGV